MIMYKIVPTTQFKRDYKKLCADSTKNIAELNKVINMLAAGETLPLQYKDHSLKGSFKNCRECHIRPDWLLVYEIKENILVLSLVRTGSHANLFKM